MILGMSSFGGLTRATCLDDIWKGASVMLVGGSPSIAEMPLSRLQERGVVSAAINNAAKHFRPLLWFSGDNPRCYDRIILTDPGILKFAPSWHMDSDTQGGPMKLLPSMFFYVPFSENLRVHDILDDHRYTPWFGNTLLTAIHILYRIGFRRIILCGCDFEPDGKRMYAHDAPLTDKEFEANVKLYRHQADTLISLKPEFEEAGLDLMDCSAKSKLVGHYQWYSFDEAVDLCAKSVESGGELRHGTSYASEKGRRAAGVWEPPPQQAI